MPPIDNFSGHADQYARFRPGYPLALFNSVAALLPQTLRAWDCGTGNGQAAALLAEIFAEVEATDISTNQLGHAIQKANIRYSAQPAEQTSFPAAYFDLIVVAQAIHWFTFDAFYQEVRRTAQPGALLLVLGYGLVFVAPDVDKAISRLYVDITGPFWDKERRYIDDGYRTIPFPFTELPLPQMENKYRWSFDHLLQYLRTWSGVQKYIKARGTDPVEEIAPDLKAAWGTNEQLEVSFPLIGRLGRIN